MSMSHQRKRVDDAERPIAPFVVAASWMVGTSKALVTHLLGFLSIAQRHEASVCVSKAWNQWCTDLYARHPVFGCECDHEMENCRCSPWTKQLLLRRPNIRHFLFRDNHSDPPDLKSIPDLSPQLRSIVFCGKQQVPPNGSISSGLVHFGLFDSYHYTAEELMINQAPMALQTCVLPI